MVVLRLIGDEWRWEEKIALGVPPQKVFNMCITLLVQKLGVDKWNGLTLYRTEGKPPRYCRPTIPLDMASNPQRERLLDGAVLWVKTNVDAERMEADRVFQASLDHWRKENGIKMVAPDGSDVQRFMEESSSKLNPIRAKDLSEREEEGRLEIEGEENRQFSFLTREFRALNELKEEEQQLRTVHWSSYVRGVEELYAGIIVTAWLREERRAVGEAEEGPRQRIMADEKEARAAIQTANHTTLGHLRDAELAAEHQRAQALEAQRLEAARAEQQRREDEERRQREARELEQRAEEEREREKKLRAEEIQKRALEEEQQRKAQREAEERETQARRQHEAVAAATASATAERMRSEVRVRLEEAILDIVRDFEHQLHEIKADSEAPRLDTSATWGPLATLTRLGTGTITSHRRQLFREKNSLRRELLGAILGTAEFDQEGRLNGKTETALSQRRALLEDVLAAYRAEEDRLARQEEKFGVPSGLHEIRALQVHVYRTLNAVAQAHERVLAALGVANAGEEVLESSVHAQQLARLVEQECAAAATQLVSFFEDRVFRPGGDGSAVILPLCVGDGILRGGSVAVEGHSRPLVHPETLDVLIEFATRYAPIPAAPCVDSLLPLPALDTGVDLSAALVEREAMLRAFPPMRPYFAAYIDALLARTHSAHAAADELCVVCRVLTHSQRGVFQRLIELYAPHLDAVLDLLLHLYTSREVELLSRLRPEAAARGSFSAHRDAAGRVYYYHSSFEMSQWERPSELHPTQAT